MGKSMSALAVQGQKSDRRQLQVVRFLSGDSSNANFNQNFADSFNNTNKLQGAKILEFKREKTKSNSVSKDRVRHFNPYMQKFLSMDPIGFAGDDLNLYNYVFNSPTTKRDPHGLKAFPYSEGTYNPIRKCKSKVTSSALKKYGIVATATAMSSSNLIAGCGLAGPAAGACAMSVSVVVAVTSGITMATCGVKALKDRKRCEGMFK